MYCVGAGSATVKIRASTLLKGRYYKLQVFANTYKSAVASAEYDFFTNCPPYADRSCTVAPESGIKLHLTIDLTVSALKTRLREG